MHVLTEEDLTIPDRKEDSHKGQHGKVLVVGGSEDLPGAVALAGIAALRAGADLVTVAAPEKAAWAVNALYPDLITKKLPGKILTGRHWKEIKELAEGADVILFGNGMGRATGTKRLVNRIAGLENRMVVDADAIRLVDPELLHDAIITPHADELAGFLANTDVEMTDDPEELQERLQDWLGNGNVVLRKGKEDLIISKDDIAVNATGNQGMTKGGTGDVLAGLCAGFYAQLKDPWRAACTAAYINGRIGDILKGKHEGYSYISSDMVEEIEKVTSS